MIKKSKALAVGAAVAAAGYVAGILTAPKSGKETREDIKNSANSVKLKAEKQLKALHSELNDKIKQGEELSDKARGKANAELKAALDKAKDAKQKARVVLSALRDGEADDPDLQKAIKEAKKAKADLAKYLKK